MPETTEAVLTRPCPHAKWPLGCDCPDDGSPHDAIGDPEITCYDECVDHEGTDEAGRPLYTLDEMRKCPRCVPRIDWVCSRHSHVMWCSPAEAVE